MNDLNEMSGNELFIKHCISITLGLQKFKDLRVAFWAMAGDWASEEALVIDERNFLETVYILALKALWLKTIDYDSEEECSSRLGKSGQKSHYLVDFNFFIYCTKNNCLYTCRKNDNYQWDEWDERQRSYLQELYDIYSIDRIVEFAETKTKEYLNNKGDNDLDCKKHLEYCWEGCEDLFDKIIYEETP